MFLFVFPNGRLAAPAVYGPFPSRAAAERQARFYASPHDTVRIAPKAK